MTNDPIRMSLSRCPLCFSRQFEDDVRSPRYELGGATFRRKRCRGCGVFVAEPLPAEADLAAIYGGKFDYSWYSRVGVFKQAQAIGRLFELRRHVGKGTKSLLEIGSGHGFFLKWAKRFGFVPIGVEISAGKSELSAADPTIPVLSWGELARQQRKYDVICLWHSLEHFVEPIAVLHSLRDMLASDGLLVIALPNASSVTKRLRNLVGREWIWDQAPYVHIWHFNPSNIGTLLRQAHFQPRRIECNDTWDANLVTDGLYGFGLVFVVKYLKRWIIRGQAMHFALDQLVRLVGAIFVPVLNPILRMTQAGNELVVYSEPGDREPGIH